MALHPPSEKLSQQMEHEKPRRAAQCGQHGGVIILYVGAYQYKTRPTKERTVQKRLHGVGVFIPIFLSSASSALPEKYRYP